MKKVGLITFHESDNFGTCLQAFALQKKIEDLSYDCEIINYQRTKIIADGKMGRIERLIAGLKSYGVRNMMHISQIKRYSQNKHILFKDFRNSYFNYSDSQYKEFEELKNLQYDQYVCGSDMIWTADRSEDIGVYFLDFVEKGKKIAYAPSFGSNTIPKELEEKISSMIQKFDALSCREQNGVKLIQNLTKRNAQLVCDPTFLLTKHQWIDLFQLKNNDHKDKKLISYLFEGTPEWAKKIVSDLQKKLNTEINYIPMTIEEIAFQCKKGDLGDGPIEFISKIYHSDYVITNSYHGLIFSLIFEKPFVVLRRNASGKWGQFEDRMNSILSLLGLEDRMISSYEEYQKIKKEIDYCAVSRKLDVFIKLSENYLKSNLNQGMELMK